MSRRYIPWRLPRRTVRNVMVAALGLLGPYLAVFAFGDGMTVELVVASIVGSIAYLTVVYALANSRRTNSRRSNVSPHLIPLFR